MPKVSVVIPTYNHRAFIPECLESVFAQTFTDFEVIVVNDGSTDGTAAVLSSHIAGGRIIYLEQPNQGQAAARNRGIAAARGEFLALLDDDDRWEPSKLQWQVRALEAEPLAVGVYGQMQTFGAAENYLTPEPHAPAGERFEDFITRVWINSPGQALLRMSAVRAAGGFDASIWGTDDWDLYLRLLKHGPILYQPRLTLHYRCHGANASKNVRRLWRNALLVTEKHFAPGGLSPSPAWRSASQRFVRQFVGEDCFRHARYFAGRGERRAVRRLLALAAWVDRRNAGRAFKAWLTHNHPRASQTLRRGLQRFRRNLPHLMGSGRAAESLPQAAGSPHPGVLAGERVG